MSAPGDGPPPPQVVVCVSLASPQRGRSPATGCIRCLEARSANTRKLNTDAQAHRHVWCACAAPVAVCRWSCRLQRSRFSASSSAQCWRLRWPPSARHPAPATSGAAWTTAWRHRPGRRARAPPPRPRSSCRLARSPCTRFPATPAIGIAPPLPGGTTMQTRSPGSDVRAEKHAREEPRRRHLGAAVSEISRVTKQTVCLRPAPGGVPGACPTPGTCGHQQGEPRHRPRLASLERWVALAAPPVPHAARPGAVTHQRGTTWNHKQDITGKRFRKVFPTCG